MSSLQKITGELETSGLSILKESIWDNKVHMALLSSDILILTAIQQFEFDLDSLKAFHKNNLEFIDNKPIRYLFQMSNHYVQIPPSVLNYIANDPEIIHFKIAEAIIVKSLPNRLIVNFYLNIVKSKAPAKLFNDPSKAYNWLLKKQVRSEQLKKFK